LDVWKLKCEAKTFISLLLESWNEVSLFQFLPYFEIDRNHGPGKNVFTKISNKNFADGRRTTANWVSCLNLHLCAVAAAALVTEVYLGLSFSAKAPLRLSNFFFGRRKKYGFWNSRISQSNSFYTFFSSEHSKQKKNDDVAFLVWWGRGRDNTLQCSKLNHTTIALVWVSWIEW